MHTYVFSMNGYGVYSSTSCHTMKTFPIHIVKVTIHISRPIQREKSRSDNGGSRIFKKKFGFSSELVEELKKVPTMQLLLTFKNTESQI